MNISTTVNGISSSYQIVNTSGKSKNKWELTDSLREQITQMAQNDAKKGVYMGKEFSNLRKSEVAGVAPNRKALIGKMNNALYGDMSNMKKIHEADERWLCMLFGKPYEAEFQGSGYGSAAHVYDENGDEILTYTGGVGWHEKPSKAENDVHNTLKSVYYEAYHNERQELKANRIISENTLDMRI